MSVRTEKVASVIKKTLARPLSELAQEIGAGLVSITDVRLSPDLRVATIQLSIYGGNIAPAPALVELQNRSGRLKQSLAGGARLRFIPELRFHLDDREDAIRHIEKLLEQAKTSSPSDSIAKEGEE